MDRKMKRVSKWIVFMRERTIMGRKVKTSLEMGMATCMSNNHEPMNLLEY